MQKKLNIVLAGQANVGKSVIFNYLTGLHQHIGNWPGKTIEKAEGTLHYKGYEIDLLDLPGIYSLSTYSLEELISREYIAVKKPDFIINVLDATHLERNLIFTLQLLELEKPTVLALNMVNLLKKRGIEIDFKKLEEILGVPTVPASAIYGKGLTKILDRGIGIIKKRAGAKLAYGKEVERRIDKLSRAIKDIDLPYPKRWVAIKLLEKDEEVEKLIKDKKPEIIEKAKTLCLELEKIHGHDSSMVVAGERCYLVSRIISKVVKLVRPQENSFGEKLDALTSHKVWGYAVMIIILALTFLAIFKFGNWSSALLENATSSWQARWEAALGISFPASLGWSAVESALALVEIAFPFIVPFYLLLFMLESWGYLARIAFLMDRLMHKMGIHGKACIPLILGFGCNVPACLSCRIMETQRERFITGFLTTFIPCSAVTVIILGLVGKFVGIAWVFGLYLIIFLIILGLGWITSKVMPGEPVELIMDMPDYKLPDIRTMILQTWSKLKEFIFIAAPLVIISGVIINGIHLAGWLPHVADFLSPVTVKWLGLPAITGILLIFGILRKELILVMLATLLGTTNFSQALTHVQMLTLALVSMLYMPCVATIAAIKKEFGWRRALEVASLKTVLAIFAGGLFFRFLSIFIK